MAKSTATYWNALAHENRGRWKPIAGLEVMAGPFKTDIGCLVLEVSFLNRGQV